VYVIDVIYDVICTDDGPTETIDVLLLLAINRSHCRSQCRSIVTITSRLLKNIHRKSTYLVAGIIKSQSQLLAENCSPIGSLGIMKILN